MEKPKPKDVESYIADSNEEARPTMRILRKIITSTVPEAAEGISYSVPIYKYHGILAGFSVAKNHVSFGADALHSEDRKLLGEKGYKSGKKTIQIKFNQEVPIPTIKKVLKAQAKINKIKNDTIK